MSGVFGGGIPDTVPVSEEGIEIDRAPIDLISDQDINEVEELQDIPETNGAPETEDLGEAEEAEIVDGIPTTNAPEEKWDIDETLEVIGEDGIDQMILFINNFTRRLVEKNLNRPPRRDLTAEQIRQTKISKQLVKTIHHYAPSLPMDSPSTGLAICALTLICMNMTSPLIPPDELEKDEAK
ncbi:hypothetical protein M0R72_06150 [Candidatus Pacearchaeota archaeon]|nr:hypothetical protein [Candidatus Pacearchaeota archaeon]